jgi:hypothetical protein
MMDGSRDDRLRPVPQDEDEAPGVCGVGQREGVAGLSGRGFFGGLAAAAAGATEPGTNPTPEPEKRQLRRAEIEPIEVEAVLGRPPRLRAPA